MSKLHFLTKQQLKVAEIKDNQIRGTLKNLETSVHHWDSDKCPAVKYVDAVGAGYVISVIGV